MIAQTLKYWYGIRESYWFVPTVMALLAAVANEFSQHLKHYRFAQTYGSSKGRRDNKGLLGN